MATEKVLSAKAGMWESGPSQEAADPRGPTHLGSEESCRRH